MVVEHAPSFIKGGSDESTMVLSILAPGNKGFQNGEINI